MANTAERKQQGIFLNIGLDSYTAAWKNDLFYLLKSNLFMSGGTLFWLLSIV